MWAASDQRGGGISVAAQSGLLKAPSSAYSVLIVDDSMIMRRLIARVFEQSDTVCVAGEMADAEEAIAFLSRKSCDLVLLDIDMPGRSGLEALPEIVETAGPRTPVMILSSRGDRAGEDAVKALSLGALESIAKPSRAGFSSDFQKLLVHKVESLCASAQRADSDGRLCLSREPLLPNIPACIAIGASTGGVTATAELLAAIDPDMRSPILITQHIPPGFVQSYARQLGSIINRPVIVASDGVRIEPGQVYLAHGKAHLGCRRTSKGAVLADDHGHYSVNYIPSVDAMFANLARCFGSAVIGVVLTGMGKDGAQSAQLLRKAGAKMLVQDEQTSAIWGMPGAIALAGLADGIGSPVEIASMINRAGRKNA